MGLPLILVGAWRLLRESTDILLEVVPSHLSLEEVRASMLAVAGVSAVPWAELMALVSHSVFGLVTLMPKMQRPSESLAATRA